MKFDNRFFLVMIGAIILYATFLVISDYSKISDKIINFKIEYLPIILIFIGTSWFALFLRWILLLRFLGIHIPFRENMKIYFSGFALAITPGKFGELVKSQLMKKDFSFLYFHFLQFFQQFLFYV